jgi:protein-S-isoprenylcysteine O-methyltransferase Ste14
VKSKIKRSPGFLYFKRTSGKIADIPIIKLPILEIQQLRKIYKQTEQRSTIVMLVALPVFGIIYLFFESGKKLMEVPEISELLVWVLASICGVGLILQYFLFSQKIKLTFEKDELLEKVKIYSQATNQRYLILLLASLVSSIGLLLSKNPVFTLFFAIVLVFFSLAKPTPDRLARLMKLKKEERELIRDASRPE